MARTMAYLSLLCLALYSGHTIWWYHNHIRRLDRIKQGVDALNRWRWK